MEMSAAATLTSATSLLFERELRERSPSSAAPIICCFITAPVKRRPDDRGRHILIAPLSRWHLYLHLHTLPERMAHKSQKLQFESWRCWACWHSSPQSLFWVIGLSLRGGLAGFRHPAAQDRRIGRKDAAFT